MAGVLLLAILVAVGRMLLFDVWKDGDFKPLRWDGKPHFVETAYSNGGPPPNATVWQRVFIAFTEFQRRHGRKNLVTYSFGARTNQLCSIHAMLNQCMEISGTRYLIANEVVAGTMTFGHTNVLSGTQWLAAIERTLETSPSQCWHPASNGFWQESLLLIREKPRVVKVVPPSRLADYQKAGLVDRSYRTNAPFPAGK